MKRSLFALAVLGAFASAATATAQDRSRFQRTGTYSVALAPKPAAQNRAERRRNRKGTRK